MTLVFMGMFATETGNPEVRRKIHFLHANRELWGEYECHFSCEDCDPSTSCKEGMTCLDDVSFVEFLIDHLVKELNVDPMRVHVTGLSNGAQESKVTKIFIQCSFYIMPSVLLFPCVIFQISICFVWNCVRSAVPRLWIPPRIQGTYY